MDTGPVKRFFVTPVSVPQDRAETVQHYRGDVQGVYRGNGATAAGPAVGERGSCRAHQQTVADARRVQHALGHHKANVEERVGRGHVRCDRDGRG